MKNITNAIIGMVFTLAIVAPTFGMGALKRSFAAYHARKAVHNTLAARLFNRSSFNSELKAQLPAKTTPTQSKKTGFFGKWLAAVPLIGWMWESNEERWAKELLRQPVINDTLTNSSWNPHHPQITKYVLGKCIMRKMDPEQCGESVKAVQVYIEEERLKRLEKLNKELNTCINQTATHYTKSAMHLGCKNKDGVEIALTQASDEQLKATLMLVEDKEFSQCKKNPEIQTRVCKPARDIAFQKLKLFRDSAQEKKAPSATTQK